MNFRFPILAGLLLQCSDIAADPERQQILFEKPKAQGEFRIPGLLSLGDGTVLAFCADRKGRGDFGHDTTTVLRRSTDGGRTWAPLREITARAGADIHSGPVVRDRSNGRIFKFCRFWPASKNAKRLTDSKTYREMVELGWIDHVQTSDDAGLTWTEPKPLVLEFPAGVVSAATGNGVHGIQLADGRLLIQGGYAERRDGKLLRRCCVFASEDGGDTWRRIVDIPTDEFGSIREFGMVERRDGGLTCNIRSRRGWRIIWNERTLQSDDELGDIECHAGLTTGSDGKWFFTHPDPVGAAREAGFNQRRQRLVLRISDDEGRTWSQGRVIHKSAAAYSDVAVMPDGTVLALYENGDRIGDCYQRISLARLKP